MKNHLISRKTKFVFFAFSIICLLLHNNSYAQDKNNHKHNQMNDSTMLHRQHMIHMKSSMVMPFAMDKVTHYFIKTDNGGVSMIKAKDSKDTSQITLIRSHLKKEKTLFSNADFRDPKALHGVNMPGLKILSESKGKFKVEYKSLLNGAQLTFTTKDSVVRNAIHKWFDAQLKDHGSDAKSNQ